MQNLRLPLMTKWFEMTKSGTKTEDYREITPYWINRLISKNFAYDCHECGIVDFDRIHIHLSACPNGFFKNFDKNIITLGYPKSTDSERILEIEHKGIEIRNGNPEWGASPNKMYFVIKHGNILIR